MIYLDYAANTPVDPAVLEVFCAAERAHPGNPNSAHQAGRAARQELDCCTAGIASLLGCLPEEILYTSGASESNNLAVKGIAHAARHVGRHILSTALEHPSVGGSLTALQQQGYEIDLVDIGRDGTVDVDQLRSLLRRDTVLVSLCAVDSELGTVQPIGAVAEALRTFPDCRLHVDATQALGKTPLCLDGVDTMSFALHKLHGLNGSGLLFKRSGLVLEPQIHGGAGVSLYRSGTPTLALAAAAWKALELALGQEEARTTHVRALNRRLREALSRRPEVRINSPAGAIPHILNLSVRGVKGADFQRALDRRGVCVSVKSACSVEGTPSKAVYAVSRDRRTALSSWRISLSHLTTEAEIEEFLQVFDACCKELIP